MSTFKELESGISSARFYHAAVTQGLAVALWRSPNEDSTEGVIDLNSGSRARPTSASQVSPGFVVAPFENRFERNPFIRADLYLRDSVCNMSERLARNGTRRPGSSCESILETLTASESTNNGTAGAALWHAGARSKQRVQSTQRAEFCDWVQRALAEINQKALRKVVLSRVLELATPADFSPVVLFENLCEVYPNAFVSLFAIPGVGTWIGATPELLLSLERDELTTVALAGTRPADPKHTRWPKQWGEKEIVEQAIVSDFIRDCFRSQQMEFGEEKTESVQIGDLLHLKTAFRLQRASRLTVHQIDRFLRNLHPTPAVCGVPKQAAQEFIKNREAHEREFYAGYLGPVNLRHRTDLFVNLRCMQMRAESVLLYAGGGITIDSVPEQEWLETELKLNAILRLLQGYPQRPASAESAESGILCYE